MHGKISGRTVLGQVHPVGALNKTLISDTVTTPLTSQTRGRPKEHYLKLSVPLLPIVYRFDTKLAIDSLYSRMVHSEAAGRTVLKA